MTNGEGGLSAFDEKEGDVVVEGAPRTVIANVGQQSIERVGSGRVTVIPQELDDSGTFVFPVRRISDFIDAVCEGQYSVPRLNLDVTDLRSILW
jgi:hypothetical protein